MTGRDGRPPPAGLLGLQAVLRQKEDASSALLGRDGVHGSLGSVSRLDQARVSQAVQQKRPSADSFGRDAADPPAAAVVHAFRFTDGGDADRYALLPPLRRNRDDGREVP